MGTTRLPLSGLPDRNTAAGRLRAVKELARHFEMDANGQPLRLTPAAQEAIVELVKLRGAPNTRRSYETGQRLFAMWYLLTYLRPLEMPVPVEAVAQFITDYADGIGRKRSDTFEAVDADLVRLGFKSAPGPMRYVTLKQRLAAIGALHAERNVPSPTSAEIVKVLMKSARRQAARTGRLRPRKKAPLLRDDILQMVDTGGSMIDVRDRALILFAFASGGRRRSEVTAARWDYLAAVRRDDGAPAFEYVLQEGKTLKDGKTHRVPILGRAAVALKAWAEAVSEQAGGGPLTGPIFRRVYGSRIHSDGLTPAQVARILKKRAEDIGLDAANVSGHSIRRGWITEGARQGKPVKDMMELTGHKSVSAFFEYIESDLASNPASDILATGDEK